MSFLKEFLEFIRQRRRFYLVIIFALMALTGSLIVLTEGTAVAPFIYTLF
jgi:hypothetical protein